MDAIKGTKGFIESVTYPTIYDELSINQICTTAINPEFEENTRFLNLGCNYFYHDFFLTESVMEMRDLVVNLNARNMLKI